MSPATKDEDENWVGTPPEGHHTRDRANPDFWRAEWPKYAFGAGVLVVLIIVVVALALILG
jgi:hypothetical protein